MVALSDLADLGKPSDAKLTTAVAEDLEGDLELPNHRQISDQLCVAGLGRVVMGRQAAGTGFAAARSRADAPQSDYTQLVGDLSLARQLQVTVKICRDGCRPRWLGRL